MSKLCRDEQRAPRLFGRGNEKDGRRAQSTGHVLKSIGHHRAAVSAFVGLTFLIISVLLLLASCSQRPRVNPEEAMEPASGYWDVYWAEPSIVASDSMFTLIQADWIDSSWVDEPPPPKKEGQTVMRFFIDDAECFVSINVVDNAGGLIRPLLVKKLRYGYYKLLVQTGPPVFGPAIERWVSLRYCDHHRQERLQ